MTKLIKYFDLKFVMVSLTYRIGIEQEMMVFDSAEAKLKKGLCDEA